jgi:hypothetical protein
MRGIKANTEPLRIADMADDVREVFEPVTETRALAGGGFKREARLHLRDPGKNAVDRGNDFLQPGFFSRAEMCTWVKDEKG